MLYSVGFPGRDRPYGPVGGAVVASSHLATPPSIAEAQLRPT